MQDMKRLLKYLGPYRKDMLIGALLIFVETCFELFIPVLIADLIDVGVANGDIPYIFSKGIQMGDLRDLGIDNRIAICPFCCPCRIWLGCADPRGTV